MNENKIKNWRGNEIEMIELKIKEKIRQEKYREKEKDITRCAWCDEPIEDDEEFEICTVCDKLVHKNCDDFCHQSHFPWAM